MTITIAPLSIPATLDAPDASDFLEVCALTNLVESERWGNEDHFTTPLEQLESSRPGPYRAKLPFVAMDGERVVGMVGVALPLGDNEHVGYVHVLVHPDFRRQGIGAGLYFAAADALRFHGRTTLMGASDHRSDYDVDGPGALHPATGAGALPSSSASVAFARGRGCQLEQVERFSVMELQDAQPGIGRHLGNAVKAAGDGYELNYWEDNCPESLVEDYALLRQRMSTDVPVGELAMDEESWDVDRVRDDEDRLLKRGGRTLVAAVRHRASGRLIGHTILEHSTQKPEVLYQEDTLVLTSHRGHRLGMLLKAANLQRVGRIWPQALRIYTWNACENAHMLGINEALGFRAAGYTGMWQSSLGAVE